MSDHSLIAARILRLACIASTLVSSLANLALLVAHRPILAALGVAMPVDAHLFFAETSLSFTVGTVGLLAVRQRTNVESLLAVGALGKGLYAVATFAACALGQKAPLFYVFAAGDALLVVVFLLYWIQTKGEDLYELQIDVFDGIANPQRAATKKALLLGMATGDGSPTLARIRERLTRGGYAVDVVPIVPQERYTKVASLARAFLRSPSTAAPLTVPDGRDWDLVVVESPVWLFGVAAPVEAALRDPANRWIFQGRDAVALVVSRGSHRRALAMMNRHFELAGANVVAARAIEPKDGAGLFPRALGPATYALEGATLAFADSLGGALAVRPRTRPHWTLLLQSPAPKPVSPAATATRERAEEDLHA